MKYKFDVTVQNNNYPLIVLYKVKTFPEYGYQIIPKTELVFDPANNNYRTTVEFSITNWLDGNNDEHHNNLSCIGDALTVDVYAFQQGVGDDFAWITPEMLRNPENYEGWESFKDTYADEYTFLPQQMVIDVYTSIAEEIYISIRSVARVAIPASDFPTSDDIQTKSITLKVLDSNDDVCVDGDGNEAKTEYTATFRKSAYNSSYFVSDILNFDKADSVIASAEKIVCEYMDNNNTKKYSYLFTTILDKMILEPINDKYIIDENIDDSFEVFFNGSDNWEKNTNPQGVKYTLSFSGRLGGITLQNRNLITSYTSYKKQSVCQQYTPVTKTFNSGSLNQIFALNPLYCYIDANGFINVKQVDVLSSSPKGESFVNYGTKADETTPLYYGLNVVS